MAITLRTLTDTDLDALFDWESDPRAVQMAAFTRANPSDRSEFDAHYERVRNDLQTRCERSTTTTNL
jgi:RimJ/RimL family protein N-acetyltransferase